MPGFTIRSRRAAKAEPTPFSADRLIAAAALAIAVASCGPSPQIAAREAAQPGAVAAAICRDERGGDDASCDSLTLADPASQIAYTACLDYNRRDLRPCARLRDAYERDLRTHLAARRSSAPGPPAPGEPAPPPAELGGRDPHRIAEALYRASNSDADTFQAALLIPDIRRKIEAALGQRLTDAQLRALLDKNRAEAVYWYDYMQRLEQGGHRGDRRVSASR